jgi:hypothetical protein
MLLVCAAMAAATTAATTAAGCGGDGGTDDPGRITLHRLNNAEYNNTVRDLLGTELRPADDFPADDRGYGFDNVADVLRLSPLLVELYEGAAEELIADTLKTNTSSTSQMFEITGSTQTGNAQNGGWLFFSNGTATINVPIAAAGQYKVTVRAYGQQAGPEVAKLSIEVVGQAPVIVDVPATQAAPASYERTFTIPQGTAQISVGFVNDFYDQTTMADRNLWVDHVIVDGPIGAPPVDEDRRAAVLICPQLEDRSCQMSILQQFAKRAWRRPPTDGEVQELVSLVDTALGQGDTAESGIKLALQAVLVSPHFIYRVEMDPSPNSKDPHPLTDWELATRLSYYLWSTMPDAELFAAAEAGTLHDRAELERQARRMLDDPKAVALVDNFAGQWLFTRALGDQDPDYMLFPDYDDELEAAMRAESRRYFEAFLDEDIPMDQFLTADFTYVNDRLAAFYGLPPVGSDEPVRVSLADTQRRGFLMQGSILRVTSRPKRTSPVLRGKWILDNLLCLPPRPPPPGVEGLPEGMTATGSIRDRLEQHKQDPVCASCHDVMDPLGFGLDNFDAIGRWRDMDAGFAIDASGTFGNAASFNGPTEMVALLAAEPQVYRCLVEKLYTYTGRSPFRIESTEHIDELTKRFADNGYILRDLLVDIVTSDFFVSRRGEP